MLPVFNLIFYGVILFIIYKKVVKILATAKSNGAVSNNKVKCPSCGRLVETQHYTCPHCGTELKKKCKNCGSWMYVGNAYCPACHKPMSGEQELQPVQSQSSRTTYAANTAKNDVKCTYHDTYSAGYDPGCKPDESYRSAPKTDYDDIGFVKGRGRTKVQTADEYMRERHSEGAYHVNSNELKSYDRKGSYGNYEDAVLKNRKAGKKSSKPSAKVIKNIIIIIVFFVIGIVLSVATDKIVIHDYTPPKEQNYYALNIKDNISVDDIADNAAAFKYFNEISESDASDEDIVKLVINHDYTNNMYQMMLYRCSKDTTAATNYIYYNEENDTFIVEEYLLNEDKHIYNKNTFDNGTYNYVQIDYFEYEIKDNEDIRNNVKCLIDGDETDIDCVFSTESLTPTFILYSRV